MAAVVQPVGPGRADQSNTTTPRATSPAIIALKPSLISSSA
jgi:hypothetical protein